ncbi:MAG TPA: hypothetical protein VMF89_13985 [Polyangiales bacterium]|nr:hypothetical protein [Polyangiales bacterium]
MSRLPVASNKLIVRELGAMFRTVGALIMLASFSACGGEAAPTQSVMDAGARTITQPVATPTKPTTSAGAAAVPALPSPPVSCGSVECMRPQNLAADLLTNVTGLPTTGAETVACCLDEEHGICSSAASIGASCDTVAVMDNRCPGVDLSALSDLVGGLFDSTQDAMIGCCTHDACGLNGKIFGRGCVENAEAKRMLSVVPVIGPLISVPAPRACDQGEPEPDTDAGT